VLVVVYKRSLQSHGLYDTVLMMRILNWLPVNRVCFAFLLLLLGFGSVPTVSGQDSTPSARQEFQITSNYITPNSFGYGLTRLTENIRLLIFSPIPSLKADFYEKLADRRLSELDKVVSEKDVANIERSSTRYFTTIGMLVEYVNKKNLTERKSSIVGKLVKHKAVIEEVLPIFNDTTAEWRFVKEDLDYLNIYISKLQK